MAAPSMANADIRLPYEQLPPTVTAWVERELGSGVVGARTQVGGFSTGTAARLVTTSGRRAFIKAVGTSLNERTVELFRAELTAMPAVNDLPWAPRLLAGFDDGDWVGLLLEDVEGRHPEHPWTIGDAELVFGALAEMHDALTPSPWPDAPSITEHGALARNRWSVLAAEAPRDLPDWVVAHFDELIAMTDRALAFAEGATLLHSDLRADNIMITRDRRVVFVDWAWARRGPAWLDVLLAALDLPYSGSALDPDALIMRHPSAPDLAPDDLTAAIATYAGSLELGARRPSDVPGLNAFRRRTADVLLEWTRRRTGW